MPLVTRYTFLEKQNFGEAAFQKFSALRAVGLAVELGWKLTRDKGSLSARDLKVVEVGGKLRVLAAERWRSQSKCTLSVAAADTQLAYRLVQQQAALLHTLNLNPWFVDTRRPGNKRPFDLVATFVAGQNNHGVHGRVWVVLPSHEEWVCYIVQWARVI